MRSLRYVWRVVALLLVSLLPACEPRAELGICEAVFRYQMDNDTYDVKIYFLSIYQRMETDPSWELMARFEKSKPPVKPVSEAVLLPSVKDRKTKQPGTVLTIYGLRRIGKDQAVVEASYFVEPQKATGHRYHLAQQDGKWVKTV